MLEDTRTPQYPYFLRSRLKLGNSTSRTARRECRKGRLPAGASRGRASKSSERWNGDSPRFLQWSYEDKNYPETPCTSLCNVMDTLSLTKGCHVRGNCTANRTLVHSSSYSPVVDTDMSRRIGMPNAVIGIKMRRVRSGIQQTTELRTQDQNDTQQPNSYSLQQGAPNLAFGFQKVVQVPDTAANQKCRLYTDSPSELCQKENDSLGVTPSVKCMDMSAISPESERTCHRQEAECVSSAGSVFSAGSQYEHQQVPGGIYHKPSVDQDFRTPEQSVASRSDVFLNNSSGVNLSVHDATSATSPSVSSSVRTLAKKIHLGTFSTLSSLKSATPDSSECAFVEDEDLSESRSHSYIVNDLKNYFRNLPGESKDEVSLYDEKLGDNISSEDASAACCNFLETIPTERSFFYVSEDSGHVVESQTEYPGAIVVTKPSKDLSGAGNPPPPELGIISAHRSSFVDESSVQLPPEPLAQSAGNSDADLARDGSDMATAFSASSALLYPETHVIGSKENLRLSTSRPYSLLLGGAEPFVKDSWTPMKKALKRSLSSKIASNGLDDSVLCELSTMSNKFRRTNSRRNRGLSFPPESGVSMHDVLPSAYLSHWPPPQNNQMQNNDVVCGGSTQAT